MLPNAKRLAAMKKRRPMRMNPPCDCRMLFGFAETAAWREPGQIVTIGTKARSGKGDNRHTPSAQIRRKTLIRKLALSLCLLAPVSAGAQDLSPNAPLLVAAPQGDLATLKRLLGGGAAVNTRHRPCDTTLLLALENSYQDHAPLVPC